MLSGAQRPAADGQIVHQSVIKRRALFLAAAKQIPLAAAKLIQENAGIPYRRALFSVNIQNIIVAVCHKGYVLPEFRRHADVS